MIKKIQPLETDKKFEHQNIVNREPVKLYYMYVLNHEEEELRKPSHTAFLAKLAIFIGAGRCIHCPADLKITEIKS